MRAVRANQHIPFWPFGGKWYARLGLSKREFESRLRDFYEALFREHAARQGKQRWGEKTPWHLWHVKDMARLFPDSVFLGIVRHPGGNVASNISRFGHGLRQAARQYSRYNTELARQGIRLGDRFALVRYEDLVLETEPVLRELLEWLGEPWSDQVLEHQNVQARRRGRKVVEGRTRVDDPVDVSRVSKWTAAVDEDGRATLERRLGELAGFFGYAVDQPTEFAPLAPDGTRRRLIRGSELKDRSRSFPGLDLHTPAEAPIVERPYRARLVEVRRIGSQPPPPPPSRRRTLRRGAVAVVRQLPAPIRRGLIRVVRRARPASRVDATAAAVREPLKRP